MSSATLTASAAGAVVRHAGATRADWISLAEAARILNRHPTSVQRAALAGAIRHQSVPGMRTRYSREDVERLAS
jgi:hypothetical protein